MLPGCNCDNVKSNSLAPWNDGWKTHKRNGDGIRPMRPILHHEHRECRNQRPNRPHRPHSIKMHPRRPTNQPHRPHAGHKESPTVSKSSANRPHRSQVRSFSPNRSVVISFPFSSKYSKMYIITTRAPYGFRVIAKTRNFRPTPRPHRPSN